MPVDYSKWDALELSDDSDIEVHQNVDKRSFIRAKQRQIHESREQRKLEIEKFKYERIINDQLMERISSLISLLRSHAAEAKTGDDAASAAVFRALVELSPKNPADDYPPPRPPHVHADQQEPMPSYSKMMATMLDQVNKTVKERNPDLEGKPSDSYEPMVEEIGVHLQKVKALQEELIVELAKLEKEGSNKITSEGIHTGFDSSHINKATPTQAPAASSSSSSKNVELLNPGYSAPAKNKTTADPSTTVQDDNGDDNGGDDADTKASPAAQQFGVISPSNYNASLEFLSRNPALVMTEKETDGLLIMAFDAELQKKGTQAKNYVHQALLLQYCRALGRDGVALFFRRINTPGHKARSVFYTDVNDTYNKIKTRAAEIAAETEREGGVEQIQLHAMQDGTVINIRVPPPVPEGVNDEEARREREIFEGLDSKMRQALEGGKLDEVNKVLGDMTVPEAEEVVAKFGEAGILSLQDEILDMTTEEGKQHLKELEEDARAETERERVEGRGEEEKARPDEDDKAMGNLEMEKAENAKKEADKMAERYADPE